MSTKTFLVTGATGMTGGHTARLLLGRGHRVRAFVHRADERSEALDALGAEVVVGDLQDLHAVSAALIGIEAAYFVYPIRPGLIEATAYFAEAARTAKISAIVNLSQKSARREAASDAARQHWVAERVFDRCGVPVTHLRPTLFAEWLLYLRREIIQSGRLRSPFGEGRHAPIAAGDQAYVIANILDAPEAHAGQIYPLYGPVELTQVEVAAEVGRALSRDIVFEAVDDHAFAEQFASAAGKTPYFAQHIESIAKDYRAGIFSGTNDIVATIGGTEPTTVGQFVERHKRAFQA